MAPLQLSQVNGSNTIVQAAQAVDMFTQVNEVLGYNFGDPFLLGQTARLWSTSSTGVANARELIAPSGKSGTTNYWDTAHTQWTGTAANNFFTEENVLETGFTKAQSAMDAMGTQLNALVPVILAAWASSVATTLAAIYDLSKLLIDKYGAKPAPAAAAPAPPAPQVPPANPVIVQGPGGTQILQPANNQGAPPPSGGKPSLSSMLALDAARLAEIAKLLKEWIAAILAHLGAMWKYNQQVATAMTALTNSLSSATNTLPGGRLPAVP